MHSPRRSPSGMRWPVPYVICRCKFVKSTTSKSTSPICPTPAAVKYKPRGAPSPPVPIRSTRAVFSFSRPSIPTSGMIKCRLYRKISSLVSPAVAACPSIAVALVDISGFPITSLPVDAAQRKRERRDSRRVGIKNVYPFPLPPFFGTTRKVIGEKRDRTKTVRYGIRYELGDIRILRGARRCRSSGRAG